MTSSANRDRASSAAASVVITGVALLATACSGAPSSPATDAGTTTSARPTGSTARAGGTASSSEPTFSKKSIRILRVTRGSSDLAVKVVAPPDTRFTAVTNGLETGCQIRGRSSAGMNVTYRISCSDRSATVLRSTITYGDFDYGFTTSLKSPS